MNSLFYTGSITFPGLIAETADYIESVQLESGAIPWFKGHLLDPWDHVEAAMGLAIAGRYQKARKALEWMAAKQMEDGSFWPTYTDDKPLDTSRKESHHAAYFATGLWHHYLITKNYDLLFRLWPNVEAGIEFALRMQTDYGDISWALDKTGNCCPDALVTGCASIYKSLECAICMADVLGKDRPLWRESRKRLGHALVYLPDRFDRTWESKKRFSMDWFYPIFCGVFLGEAARKRIQDRWEAFIHPGRGCRCVSDEPWVTVAESCELIMALISVGRRNTAARVFNWLQSNQDKNGAYWTGYQTELKIFWPKEQTTWTAGAVLMASDALNRLTPASRLFTSVHLPYQSSGLANSGCEIFEEDGEEFAETMV